MITSLVLDFMENCKCLLNTKNLNTTETKQLVKMHCRVLCRELNFPELTVEEIKFKIKAINTRYAAEIAKVI